VSDNDSRVAGWGGRPARWSASFVNDRGGYQRWWAGTVARPPSAQVSSVVRASGRRCSILRVHASAPLRFRPCLLRTGETGWQGAGGAKPTLSSLVVPIKDVSE